MLFSLPKVLTISLCVLFAGCASGIVGSSQDLVVTTNPPGAECALQRYDDRSNEFVMLGTIKTPGSLHVDKTKNDIEISCDKAGFVHATTIDKSGYPDYQWAYILVGGPIGWGFDSISGADNYYETPVELRLSSIIDHGSLDKSR